MRLGRTRDAWRWRRRRRRVREGRNEGVGVEEPRQKVHAQECVYSSGHLVATVGPGVASGGRISSHLMSSKRKKKKHTFDHGTTYWTSKPQAGLFTRQPRQKFVSRSSTLTTARSWWKILLGCCCSNEECKQYGELSLVATQNDKGSKRTLYLLWCSRSRPQSRP